MDHLSADLFQRMIAVGARDDLSGPVVRDAFPELADHRDAWPLYNDTLFQAWRLYGQTGARPGREHLSVRNLQSLLRCMVMCETHLGLSGGSVSAVKWWFADLRSVDPDLADELSGWIVDNRGGNDWIPWGNTSDARSFADFERGRRERIARISAAEASRSQAAERRQQEAAARQVEHALSAEDERPQREARIAAVLDKPPLECVREVIASVETADYWPVIVAVRCAVALRECSVDELQQLLSKARSARSEWWRALRQPIREELLNRSA